MNLKQLKKIQEQFDIKHFGKYDETPEGIMFTALCLCGEVGEFANIVKKVYREIKYHPRPKDDLEKNYPETMKEELIDIFIYILILASKLNIDIEKSYFAKMAKNKKRFKK